MSRKFPQLRRDPIIDRWVLIAPERASRPGALVAHPDELPDHDDDCPFCEGREVRTPPELLAVRPINPRPNGPGWKIRVVPNRYPAARDAVGSHELIVECPRHEVSLAHLSAEQIAEVFRAVRDRMRSRKEEGQWRYAQWFKNHGTAAGASLSHAHSQMICLPDVPPIVQMEVDAVNQAGECLFCRLGRVEMETGERVVFDDGEYIAMAANAGRFPFETWLMPKVHQACFDEVSDRGIPTLAGTLRRILQRIDQVLGRPGYNLILHTGPWTQADFHWHFELLPRITGIAGFELGANIFINPVPPEEAARQLRG
jgi:UDPglucose--hexose-1-phosphate uridylyltransferase